MISDAALYLPLALVAGVSAPLVVLVVVLGIVGEMAGALGPMLGGSGAMTGRSASPTALLPSGCSPFLSALG